jgi:hypothetical protein
VNGNSALQEDALLVSPQMTDPSSRQIERPISTDLQMLESNKNQVVSPQMGALFQDRLADWPSVVTYRLRLTLDSFPVHETVSSEATVSEQLQRQLRLTTRRKVTRLCVINL